MSRIAGAARAWVELMDKREAPTALAITRILIALCVLGDLLQAYHLGVVEAVWAPPPFGTGHGASDPLTPFMIEWFGAGVETAWKTWTLAVVAGVLVLFGVLTRVSTVVLVIFLAQLGHIGPDGDRGIDYILRAALLVIALSGSHARFSFDAWFRRAIGRPMPALVPAWPRYLLFAQLVWIYFSAAHNKGDPSWGPLGGFSALPAILCDPHFARFSSGWVGTFYPLLQLATLTSITFEFVALGMPLFTWWERTAERPGRLRRWSNRLRLRWVWILTGILFHLGIALFMRLGMFPFGMLALYPVLFHPDELAELARFVRRRGPRSSAAAGGDRPTDVHSPSAMVYDAAHHGDDQDSKRT